MEPRHPHEMDNRARRRRERPLWRLALAASAALHALVFLLFPVQSVLISPFAAAGPRAGDDQAAPGSMQAMNLSVPPARPVIPPPLPLPTVTDLEPVDFEPEPFVEPSTLSGDAMSLDLTAGLEAGTGQGDGGQSDEGLRRLVPPSPRGMIIPPASRRARGEEVEVWVFVDARGRVVPDSTQLRPPSPDRDWNRRVIREASEWRFDPARKAGEPVASWFNYRIIL